MTYLRGHWQLLALVALVFALWSTPVMVPLKILVVMLHELSHAIMALVTGGEIVSLSVNANQGGEVWTRGGNRFLTLTAGYLGSLLIGLGLLIAALRTHLDRVLMAGFGIALLVVTALYVRDLFAFGFGAGTGAIMLAVARFGSIQVNDLILRVIALTSIVYVPYDIFSDTIARSALRSDARMLAEEFGGATMMWGGLWLVISLWVIWVAVRRGLGADSNIHFGSGDTH
ncbi:M50 family metallopeptidase [Yoonia sp. 208BN28-4]|uniref:M50 family metallopeptidase n=1 Tax=Yoonia sp. 208BN28-4 TaxID=3126505 RepID=UPI0030A43710